MYLSEILALARIGAIDAAWTRFSALEGVRAASPQLLTLKGRLLKDRAAAQIGLARSALLREAAEAYGAAAALAPATYPLINAATLSLLSGEPARAAQRARETLALLDSGAHEPDTPYWLGATRAEALLLLGREPEARLALRRAVTEAPQAWEDHAVTIRQFRWILRELGLADGWLDALRPPAALHFGGPMAVAPHDRALEAAIEAAIAAIRPGTATGALAAGFDIVVAEILVRNGVELNLVLPGGRAAFLTASVRGYGGGWEARFERLLAQAATVETLEAPVTGITTAHAVLAEEMAIGIAIREARLRGAEPVLLRHVGYDGMSAPAEDRKPRTVTVQGAPLPRITSPAPLPPPERPCAFVACAAEAVSLVRATSAIETAAGALLVFEELSDAAAAAMTLFVRGGGAVALDYRAVPPAPEAAVASALRQVASGEYPVATRAAALALEAQGAPYCGVLAGECATPGETIEFFGLWPGDC